MNTSESKATKFQNVVIFDLDHTISKKDTYLQFLLFLLWRYPLHISRCLFLPWYVLLFKLNLYDNSSLKEKFLTAIAAGMRRGNVEEASKDFIQKLLHSGIYASARERILFHKNRKDYLILATASFDFYVSSLSRYLAFDAVVCTRAEWDAEDRLTGRIAGRNCYGLYKREKIEEALCSLGSVSQLTVYSDHHSDLPVFSLADHAVAVNPSAKLQKIADQKNIRIERWQ